MAQIWRKINESCGEEGEHLSTMPGKRVEQQRSCSRESAQPAPPLEFSG